MDFTVFRTCSKDFLEFCTFLCSLPWLSAKIFSFLYFSWHNSACLRKEIFNFSHFLGICHLIHTKIISIYVFFLAKVQRTVPWISNNRIFMGIWEMKRKESFLSLPAILTNRYKFAGQKKLSRFLWPKICLLIKSFMTKILHLRCLK